MRGSVLFRVLCVYTDIVPVSVFIAFTCPYEGCGRSFSVQSNMRRHARVHTRGASTQSGELLEEDIADEEEYPSSESSSPNSRK